MTQKWYKATDVCEMAQLQPYVLRSWEKEFPGIGVQKSAESPRLYRQSDVEQVLRIKQLVFGEGLTLAGARRRLEASAAPAAAGATDHEVAEVLEALASDARTRIASVRDGLRSILKLLSSAPGTLVVVDDYRLEPPPSVVKGARRAMSVRSKTPVVTNRASARKPARPAKRNKRASA
ncbi:MAG TPA: MerR family transcriptional regulator [Vicinamibacterales bacterium]|nr:MerR family transcriptional regulator [Vicinamibacterales bacterium]